MFVGRLFCCLIKRQRYLTRVLALCVFVYRLVYIEIEIENLGDKSEYLLVQSSLNEPDRVF